MYSASENALLLLTARKWGRRSTSYTFELEDGTSKTFRANEQVKTQRGLIPAYQVTEDDELV